MCNNCEQFIDDVIHNNLEALALSHEARVVDAVSLGSVVSFIAEREGPGGCIALLEHCIKTLGGKVQ